MKSFSQRKTNSNSNEKGAVLLITVVVISMILITVAGVGAFKVSGLAKESYRLNESLNYLSIMEEMGQIIGSSFLEAQGGATACPAGKTRTALVAQSGDTKQICLPGAGIIGDICIDQEVAQGGVTERYCLIPGVVSGRAGVYFITDNKEKDAGVFVFNIVKKEEKRNFVKLFNNLLFPSSAVAAPPPINVPSERWRFSHIPTPPPGEAYVQPPAPPPITPDLGAVTASPGEETSGGVYAGGGNMEPWRPTPAWAQVTEIRVPSCTSSSEQRFGCMTCNVNGVTCIEFRMCPPSNLGCTDPYVQRIAVYGK